MRLGFAKSPTFLIALPVIALFCVLEIFTPLAVKRLEWMTYDWRTRLAHRFPASNVATNLGLVEIDDNTITTVNNGTLGFRYGLYWPRAVYAYGLSELSREGAKAVGFDVLFAERRPDHPDITLSSGETISSDELFAREIKKAGNVILAATTDVMPSRIFRTNAWMIGNISVERDGDGVLRRARAFEDLRAWHPLILSLAAQLNADLSKTLVQPGKIIFYKKDGTTVGVPTDKNGNIARAILQNPVPPGLPKTFAPYVTVRAWSMGIVLATAEYGFDLDHAQIKPGAITLHGTNGLTRTIPVDDRNYFYVNWALTENDANLTRGPFDSLLSHTLIDRPNGENITNIFTNKLVVIGSTATGNELADLGSTALESETHLVIKHLNVANSIMTGRFIHVTPKWLNLLLIIAVGVFAAWITWTMPKPFHGSALMAAFTVVYLGLAAWLFVAFRFWIPIVLPLVCSGFVTHLSILTYRVRFEQTEKKMIKQLFSRVLSPEVVTEVVNRKTLALGGVRREITVYFADVRGFTELSDDAQAEAMNFVLANGLTPEEAEQYVDEQARETLATVSAYLGSIANIIKQHGGTLDKFIGDCVMAFWGAPLPNPRHAVDAVRAAVAAQTFLANLNLERKAENDRRMEENIARAKMGLSIDPLLPVLSMGSGINTGTTIVGFMGSESHLMNYTAFGREVNLASRLEGISGHGRILIGESTYLALQRDAPDLAALCIEWPPRSVKGFREPVKLFEVLWQPQSNIPPAPEDDSKITEKKPAAV